MRAVFILLSILSFFQIIGLANGTLNAFEKAYMSLPNRTFAREYLHNYTSYPHIAGSPGDYQSAMYTLNKFLSFGWNASLVTHEMYANYPLQRQVKLMSVTGDVLFTANMTEPAVEQDPTSNNPNIVPTFNGYSASGNTTAPLIYANYGRIEDFEYLQSVGINVSGAVVIVKYGKVFRGVKAMLAQKYGASGLLIYSDPANDGFVPAGGENNTYPFGPWRPEFGVQRGSVQYLPICPGTPSQERVKLCKGEEHADDPFVGTLIPSIPVQPLSWGDAMPLLKSLVGTTIAPSDWQGGLSSFFNYSLGPSNETSVNLDLVMNYTTLTIWNVIATLPGQRSDEIVLLGNHRDAWVFGATDPNSGSSVMLETARSLAQLKNTTTWVPQRDIVFCSWDAEEYGLIGSTAWGELNAEYLQKRVIAYVNTDVGVSGNFLDIGGTPSLRSLMLGVTNDLPYPGNTSIPLSVQFNFTDDTQLSILGSGSDYTVFLDHLGIPSVDIGYGSYSAGGVYHSIYDSFYWMENFGDPEFIFHEGLAQLIGVVILRLSDSAAHPFNFTNYAQQLSSYMTSIQAQAPNGTDFTVLANAIASYKQASLEIDAQSSCAMNINCTLGLDALNTRLRLSERRMLLNAISNSTDGLPYRPWYKHAIQAPGIYLGYGSQTFPGIMQGIIDNNTVLIQQQIVKAAIAINDTASALTELSVSGTSTPAKCYGDTLGGIVLTSKGGFSPVYYSINRTEWAQFSNFSNLPAGSYSLYVRDSLGFNASVLVNITQPDRLEVKVEVKKSKVSAVATGGFGDYKFVWSTTETTNQIKLKKEGNYTVTVTDSNGCSAGIDFAFHPPKESGLSGGGVAGIVITVLIIIGVIVAGLYYVRRRNKTLHYQNL